jgi:hypothetical protein
MAVDDRITLDLMDIQAIQLDCRQCPTSISCAPDKLSPKALYCPNCGEVLLADNSEEIDLLRQFARTLRKFTDPRSKDYSFTLRLQVTNPATVQHREPLKVSA